MKGTRADFRIWLPLHFRSFSLKMHGLGPCQGCTRCRFPFSEAPARVGITAGLGTTNSLPILLLGAGLFANEEQFQGSGYTHYLRLLRSQAKGHSQKAGQINQGASWDYRRMLLHRLFM